MVLGIALLAVGIGFGACSGDDPGGAGPSTTTQTTSAGGSTTTSSSSSGGGGQGPIQCSDTYTTITGECDLLKQDCPPGDECAVKTMGGTGSTCRSAQNGLKDRGMQCTSPSECMNGMVCANNRCSPFCCPSTDEPCGSGTCDVQLNFAAGQWAMVCSYLQSCTLFAHQCTSPQECHIGDVNLGVAVCDSPSDSHVGEGEVCQYRNDCGDDQICNRSGADLGDGGNLGKCRYLCQVDGQSLAPGEGGCPASQTCTTLSKPALPNIGKCGSS